jgi:hypothetical protein
MGEYANYKGQQIKIGTGEAMYYLRYEDRAKVRPIPNSLDPKEHLDILSFRLPFPDEDGMGPGNYEDYARGSRLFGFKGSESLGAGTIQLTHPNGLLLNAPCYHGSKLPDGGDIKAFWNGRDPHHFELLRIGVRRGKVAPIIQCKYCRKEWNTDWADIEEYIEPGLRKALSIYIEEEHQTA